MKKILFILLTFSFLISATIKEANDLYVQEQYKAAMGLYLHIVEKEESVEAMYNIANMYYLGQGVLKDYKIAYDWYKRGADKGDALSMYNISLLYERGEGVRQDDRDSFKWCEKAAKSGLPLGMYKLGLMYILGYGTSQDMSQAKYWVNLSYENGISQAKITWEQNQLWKF